MISSAGTKTAALMLAFIVAGLAHFTEPALGQDAEAEQEVSETRFLKLYQLRFAESTMVYESLMAMVGDDVRVSYDNRTNSVLIVATAEAHEELASVLEAIDVADPQPNELRIISLNGNPDRGLVDALRVASPEVDFSIDPARQLMILRGRKDDVKLVETMLAQFEQVSREATAEAEAASAVGRIIRIVWLRSSSDDAPAPALQPELAEAVKPLEQMGFSNLGQTAQILVSTSVGGEPFSAEAILTGDSDDREFAVAGTLEDESIQLNLIAGEANVEATVTMTPGQWVILGAVGHGSVENVFAMQMIAK